MTDKPHAAGGETPAHATPKGRAPDDGQEGKAVRSHELGTDLPSSDIPSSDARDSAVGQRKWLHPSSLLFEFASGIRSQLFPALLAIFSATTGTWVGGLIALAFFVGSMVMLVLHYVSLRYRLSGDELIVDQGIIFRVHRTVPVERIQNIDLVQNPFHRLLGVAEVRVETASGTEPEAVLRVLALADVESLRAGIFARKQKFGRSRAAVALQQSRAPVAATGATEASGTLDDMSGRDQPPATAMPVAQGGDASFDDAVSPRETLLKISLEQLALAGIASNRGTILLFVGLGFVTQQASSAVRAWNIDADDITRYLPESVSGIVWLVIAVVGLLTGLMLVKLLSIAWYVLKFYDYTLDRSGEDLRVTCGLLTRVSATVRRDRIQLISIHRTLIARWLKIASIRIETAGGGSDSDDPASTIGRRWFMPVISEAQVPAIMERLSPGLQWHEPGFAWQPLASNAAWRMRRLIALLAGLLTLVAAVLGLISVVFMILFMGAFGWWWSGRQAAAMRYARNDDHILFRSGVFTRKCSLAFIDKIQSVTIDRSPFDQRWNMATLSVDTVASGPAEHRIVVPMLDTAFAHSERDTICRAASLSWFTAEDAEMRIRAE